MLPTCAYVINNFLALTDNFLVLIASNKQTFKLEMSKKLHSSCFPYSFFHSFIISGTDNDEGTICGIFDDEKIFIKPNTQCWCKICHNFANYYT